jgi:hypothetical protein
MGITLLLCQNCKAVIVGCATPIKGGEVQRLCKFCLLDCTVKEVATRVSHIRCEICSEENDRYDD